METPRSESYGDIYFCEEDGFAEGDHVFLRGNSLPERWLNRKNFVIAETGFGTGLNFLCAWTKWDQTKTPGQHLTYISVEKFPLTAAAIRTALSRWKSEIGSRLESMLAKYPPHIGGWHKIHLQPDVTLLLIFDDANRALPELRADVDAWFLDGFAPAKNPEMWTGTVFSAMAANSVSGTTFASFTAAGIVKNGLREVGFHVEKSRGFGRKRDMISGYFKGPRLPAAIAPPEHVAVIGAGMAGANIAARLRNENIEAVVYEAKGIGGAASGNPRGLFNPRFTAQRNAVSDFYASAFSTALRQFSGLDDIGLARTGSLHLLTDDDKARRLNGMVDNWCWHDDHAVMLSAQDASDIAGVALDVSCLYLPDAGSVSPVSLVARLLRDCVVHQQTAAVLELIDGQKTVNKKPYDAVIFANGTGILNNDMLNWMPFHSVRGQLSYARPGPLSASLRANLCYGGYCTPALDGMHVVGSTFQPWLSDTSVRDDDHDAILKNFELRVSSLKGQLNVTGGRAGLRVAAKDRMPVIGAVTGHAGVFISAGHGSHGLTSSGLAADIIVDELLGRPMPVPLSVQREVAPRRFIERSEKKGRGGSGGL